MAFKQRVSEFQSVLSAREIDVKHLKRLCFSGIPDGSGIRSLCWKLMLGYLPLRTDLWPETLKRQRATYKQFVREFIIEQCKGTKSGKDSKEFDVDHPLNPNPDSNWLAFFKDNEVLLQIDKDCRRLCPDISFFQIATKFPNKDVTAGNDRDFETLRERVLRTHLEASQVNTNRSGLKNLSVPRKIAPEEYIVLGDEQEAHWEVVERILYIYAKLNPGLGYVQGMNEIIGPLYYVFCSDPNAEWQEHVEADAFFCFTNLMSEIRDNFIKSLDDSECGIGSMMKSVRRLLKERDPLLFSYLEEQQMRPQFYSFRWLTLLLSQEFALPDVIRVWDSLFADESRFDFLIYVCCAMHMVIRDQILAGDFATTMKLLQLMIAKKIDQVEGDCKRVSCHGNQFLYSRRIIQILTSIQFSQEQLNLSAQGLWHPVPLQHITGRRLDSSSKGDDTNLVSKSSDNNYFSLLITQWN